MSMRSDPHIGLSLPRTLGLFAFLPLIALQLQIWSDTPVWLIVASVSVPFAAIVGRGFRDAEPVPLLNDGARQYFCDSVVTALATALAASNREIYLHCRRVQQLSLLLANHCGIRDQRRLESLRIASLLHDLGKLAVRDQVLSKPGPLTSAELEEIKAHASVGAEIVCKLPFDGPVVEWIRLHHERWDGSGYPYGLEGEEIPLEVRILAVADCYDAIRSPRAYRGPFSRDEAVRHLSFEAGQSYDPAIVSILLDQIDQAEAARAGLRADRDADYL